MCNAALDTVSGFFTDTTTGVGTAAVFEDRIYRCVSAGTTETDQPVYDTAAGQQTTDGTAVFQAMQAWSRAGNRLGQLIEGVTFRNGEPLHDAEDKTAA